MHTVFIRGIPERADIVDVRVRDRPGVNSSTLFRIAVGTTAQVTDIQLDANGDSFQNQVYRWFFLTFSDGRQGWVRDDLLDVQGDLTAFGYTRYPLRAYAFAAARNLPPPTRSMARPISPPPAPPPPPPVAPPPPPPPPAPVGETTAVCTGTIRQDIQAKVRAQPSISAQELARLNRGTRVTIVDVVPGMDGLSFRWAKIVTVGLEGFVREDLMTYSGECNRFGLPISAAEQTANSRPVGAGSPTSLFGSPVKGNYVVTQEFGAGERPHKGADLGAGVGVPIVAGGKAVVHEVVKCIRCRADAPNFSSQNIPHWDSNAIRDPAWGFGFGNYVLLRYAWDDLPSTTRQALQGQNLAGAFIYAIYAHLSRIDVAQGTVVSADTQLGLCGNTGNSNGPHLHLELRASFDGNERSIFNRFVVNPRQMFTF